MSTLSLHTQVAQKWSKPELDLSLTLLPLLASLEGSAARKPAPQLGPQSLQTPQDLLGLLWKSESWKGAGEAWAERDPQLALSRLSHGPQVPVWKGKLHDHQ